MEEDRIIIWMLTRCRQTDNNLIIIITFHHFTSGSLDAVGNTLIVGKEAERLRRPESRSVIKNVPLRSHRQHKQNQVSVRGVNADFMSDHKQTLLSVNQLLRESPERVIHDYTLRLLIISKSPFNCCNLITFSLSWPSSPKRCLAAWYLSEVDLQIVLLNHAGCPSINIKASVH